MSGSSKIVSLYPKGVIDVAQEFVGVRPNEPNPKHQVAKLRKQVASLTAQLDYRRRALASARGGGLLFTVLAGAVLASVALGGLATAKLIGRRE